MERPSLNFSRVFAALAALFIIFGNNTAPTKAQKAPTSTPAGESDGAPAAPDPALIRKNELENLIREKAAALESINKELETTNSNLQSTKDQKASLQRELATLQSNVKQLELSMKADEITAQKLGLEVGSIQYDIRDLELTMTQKSEAISHVLRELQKNDETSPLIIFLKNDSLADGFWETQSLKNLRTQLADDIASLTNLQRDLTDKVRLVSTKKTSIELHKKNLEVRKTIVQDQQEARKAILAQTKNKETVYEQQVADLKKQQDAIEDEISKYEDELLAKFDKNLLPTKRSGVFQWPVALVSDGGKGRITQHFGEKSYLYRGRPHNGLDIGAPIGTPVFAAADGVVSAVDNNDRSKWSKYQYGRYVLIKHPNNLSTLYAHLSSQVVRRGEQVKRGDLIGYVGATGYATGPHLHLGVYWTDSIEMKSVPPAAGLVPIGVVIRPEDYL
ncbi:MAG: peptidoglycan DD-metalloendopeptidase family protein [Patescibacteria group bacterium]